MCGGLGLCGPPEHEEAVLVTCGAMPIHAVRSDEGRVQFPRPALFDPPLAVHYIAQHHGTPAVKTLSPFLSTLFLSVLCSGGQLVEFTQASFQLLPTVG